MTLDQIEKGEEILKKLQDIYEETLKRAEEQEFVTSQYRQVEKWSGEFYSLIPHFIGRNREDNTKAVIASPEMFQEKQELLQLMKDILKV